MIEEQILFFGLPIVFDDNVTLYQPTLNEMLEQGFLIEKILEPFITLDKRRFEQEEENEKVNDFDMFFVQIIMSYIQYLQQNPNDKKLKLTEWINSEESDVLVIKRLIEVLKFLFRTNDVVLHLSSINKGTTENLEDNHIMINKSYKIDRNTFSNLKEIVCEILDTEINIEKQVEKSTEMSEMEKLFAERMKQYEEKYGKRRKKEKNKDRLTIFTLINYIIHYKNTQYDYNSVRDLTIYQIKNTFKYYQGQEMYDLDMKYRTSGNFKMDKKTSEHWFFDK